MKYHLKKVYLSCSRAVRKVGNLPQTFHLISYFFSGCFSVNSSSIAGPSLWFKLSKSQMDGLPWIAAQACMMLSWSIILTAAILWYFPLALPTGQILKLSNTLQMKWHFHHHHLNFCKCWTMKLQRKMAKITPSHDEMTWACADEVGTAGSVAILTQFLVSSCWFHFPHPDNFFN